MFICSFFTFPAIFQCFSSHCHKRIYFAFKNSLCDIVLFSSFQHFACENIHSKFQCSHFEHSPFICVYMTSLPHRLPLMLTNMCSNVVWMAITCRSFQMCAQIACILYDNDTQIDKTNRFYHDSDTAVNALPCWLSLKLSTKQFACYLLVSFWKHLIFISFSLLTFDFLLRLRYQFVFPNSLKWYCYANTK